MLTSQIMNIIKQLGGPAAVARALGIRAPSVIGWRGRVPADRCPDLERAFGVPVEDLRPDLRWVRVKDRAWPDRRGRPCLDVANNVDQEHES
jgi:DNA-binding transcriptional regulator YdaS (Cro superfamily)